MSDEFALRLEGISTSDIRSGLSPGEISQPSKVALAQREIARREKAEAARKEFSREIKTLREEKDARQSALVRLSILGNAGGAIATLSFMGTLIGSGGTFGYDVLAILVCFMFGLLCGWISRAIEWEIAARMFRDAVDVFHTGGDFEYGYPIHLNKWLSRVMMVGFCALGLGVVLGLSRLALMAS